MKSPIRKMFDEIAARYDFLNHTLSCFRDIAWRKSCCKALKARAPKARVLDLCGGTGDFYKTYKRVCGTAEIAVLGDFALNMLERSKGKSEATCIGADALSMPFKDNSFDVVLNGFGMRNLPDTSRALKETARVLSDGGYFMVLDFFSPRNAFGKFFYKCLAPVFIPLTGAFFSGKKAAYQYLVDSVLRFLSASDFVKLAEEYGFKLVHFKEFDFGIAYGILLQKK